MGLILRKNWPEIYAPDAHDKLLQNFVKFG
jgi:hypothetical protein